MVHALNERVDNHMPQSRTKNENIQDNKCMYKNAGRLLTRCYTSSNTCETNDIKRVAVKCGFSVYATNFSFIHDHLLAKPYDVNFTNACFISV